MLAKNTNTSPFVWMKRSWFEVTLWIKDVIAMIDAEHGESEEDGPRMTTFQTIPTQEMEDLPPSQFDTMSNPSEPKVEDFGFYDDAR
jgi:hypothetical protein